MPSEPKASRVRPAGRRKAGPGRALAVLAARIAQHNNAQDIVVLDLRAVSPVTDYFVIATGSSSRQMRAVAEEILQQAGAAGQRAFHVAGLEGGQWVVLDFVDVVVHVFDEPHRRYYDLELIWGAAPHVRWKARAPARPAPAPDGHRPP